MITLELSPQQLDDLYNAATSHQGRKVRKKCMTVYLRGLGHTREDIACIVRSDLDTVTNQVKRYAKGGLQALLENNYRKPESPLKAFAGQLTDLFEKQPPAHGLPSHRDDFCGNGHPASSTRPAKRS